MIQYCYHWPPMKSWLTSTDLGSRGFFAKSVSSRSFLRKPYLKNMSPEFFCYGNFLTDFIKSSLRRGCHAKSVSSESHLKDGIIEFCPPKFFIFTFLHQNEGLDNLRTRKFDVNKIWGKAWQKKKKKNMISGYYMLVINYY